MRSTENIALAPQCRQVVAAKIELEKGRSSLAGLCGTCDYTPGGILVRVISRVGTSVHETLQTGRALVMLANFSHEILNLPKSTVLGGSGGVFRGVSG